MKPKSRTKIYVFLSICHAFLIYFIFSNTTEFMDRLVCTVLGTCLLALSYIGVTLMHLHEDMLWISMHFSGIQLEKIKKETIKEFDEEAKNLTKEIDDTKK